LSPALFLRFIFAPDVQINPHRARNASGRLGYSMQWLIR
jgi:hypothetical protein